MKENIKRAQPNILDRENKSDEDAFYEDKFYEDEAYAEECMDRQLAELSEIKN